MRKEKIFAISLFAGVGGIDLGLKKAFGNKIEILMKNEINPKAVETLNINFKNKTKPQNIWDLNEKDLPDHDLLAGGFPCQPFSIAGKRNGFSDERGTLIFKVMNIVKIKKPRFVFLENVKNLVSINKGKNLLKIINILKKNGYSTKWKVLNTKDYTPLPQNRERVFILAFRDKKDFDKHVWPTPFNGRKMKIKDVLLKNITKENGFEKYFYENNSISEFLEKIDDKELDFAYQWRRTFVRKNKSGVFPTLTANMGTGGHNVPLIKTNLGWRKITPRESFNIQGFPKEFKLPNIADSHLYMQAGNSVSVPLIQRIGESILSIL